MFPRFFGAILPLLVLPILAFAESDVYTDPANAGPDFAVQGEYTGDTSSAQVIALGDGKFHIVGYTPALPGAAPDVEKKVEVDAARSGDKVVFDGKGWKGDISGDTLTGTNEKGSTWKLQKTLRKSPTLGAKPPAGALVLFDGSSADAWKGGKIENGLLVCGTTSKQAFGDSTLHVEFRTPFMPKARGQGRGNSGVYLQDRYECQVLDSFGLNGDINETGAIYSKSKPKVNACFPPLSWQTYDVDFEAARWEGDKKTKNAIMTVKLNGILVQDHVEVNGATPGAGLPEGPAPGPIQLQNHGNPVFFQNIWIVEKK